MGADEEQGEALIREGGRGGGALRGEVDQRAGGGGADAGVAGLVGQTPTGGGQQPGLRPVRHALCGPGAQGGGERIRQSVLSGRDVARAGGEPGQEAAVGGAGGGFDDVGGFKRVLF